MHKKNFNYSELEIVSKAKGKLLRNKYVKKLNNNRRARKFYNNGLKPGKASQTILFWSTGGMVIQTNLEGVVASALKLRGYKVHMILCDGVFKACAKRVDTPDVSIEDWGKYCRSCIRQNTSLLERLGIEYTYISELISKEKILELRMRADEITFDNFNQLSLNGIELGRHLKSAMERHTKGGSFAGFEKILKEYAFTVLIIAQSSEEAVKRFKPSKVYMSHGIYADWGPALSVSLNYKIPVISYICCYLTAHFFFGIVKNFEETFLATSNKSWDKFRNTEITEIQKQRVYDFINKRYLNAVNADLKGILKEYKGSREFFIKKYKLDSSKPMWGIMTHINWDAVSDYFPMIYKNFDEWLYETVKKISKITDVQWLIKIHPSEINDNPNTGCQKFIEKNFPELPSHITILKMDDDISPLDFYSLLDGGATVMGTGGLELSLQGKPVILAGDAHYSNKGFTYDAKNDEQYGQLLGNAHKIKELDDEKRLLAVKYAYVYFMKKQIPLLPTIKEDLHIDFALLNHLIPGRNKFMDFLCERIIDGEDFILPEELVEQIHILEKEAISQIE